MNNKVLKNLNLIRKKKKIVLCHGVFDLLHTGHIKYFNQAKSYGDVLVVSVTSDQYVNKGPLRPVNKIGHRIEILNSLKQIDYVIESKFPTAEKIIEKIRPHIYCKGPDYKNKSIKDINLKKEISKLKKHGGKFISVNHTARSSSKIINSSNMDLSNDEFSKFLKKVRLSYDISSIKNLISNIKKLKVLVLGEMIIDKYILAEAIGKSGKDSMLVFKEISQNKFIGGTGYISNLCSSFCGQTNYFFHVGKLNSEINFLKKNINKNINYQYFYKNNSPTISKLRYLDSYKNTKIIGIYNINDESISAKEENNYLKKIEKYLSKSDAIILADYGHGEITDKIRNRLNNYSKKMFLNTQINSFNSGHHTLKKYKKIHVLCINEGELRYETKDRSSTVNALAKKLYKEIKYKYLIVTRGKFGSVLFHENKNFFSCPAFVKNPIDTIGSGDTFFSLVSMCLASKIHPQLSLLIATLAAGYSVKNLGNKKTYNIENLLDNLKHLFS